MKHEATKSRETTKQTSEVPAWSAASELLAASREGNVVAVEAAVEKLEGAIDAHVLGLLRGSLGRLANEIRIGAPELTHWAVSQLRRKPPVGKRGATAEVTLKAWCNTTVRYRLLSLWRKLRDESRRLSKAEEEGEDKCTAKPKNGRRPELEKIMDPTAAADGSALRSDRAEAIAEMLRACFPRGLELAQMRVDAPEASDRDLAVRMGISYANLHQVRKRARVHAAAFEKLQEDDRLEDGSVAKSIRASASRENLAAIARVRRYLSEASAVAACR